MFSSEEEGVTLPSVIREVQPVYTQAAMEAGIEGDVLLTAVVRPDGTVSQVDIVDSLDAELGLDESAVEAAGQWRFEPGTVGRRARRGEGEAGVQVRAGLTRPSLIRGATAPAPCPDRRSPRPSRTSTPPIRSPACR